MDHPATWFPVSVIIWDATSTKITTLLLCPATLPPATASPRPAQCVAASPWSSFQRQIHAGAHACPAACLRVCVSGSLGADSVLTAVRPHWAVLWGPGLLPAQQPLCALRMTTLLFQPLQGSDR